MKYKWLNKDNNINLILFFNGWGMDESVVKHLNTCDYDVLMFFDYNNLNTDLDFSVFNNYKNKYLIAWSMGVMIASLFNIEYTSKTAINGTLKPIDNNFGIPEKIYNLTLKSFSPESAKKFIKNMYNEDFGILNINRDFENQKSELKALLTYKANENFKYDKVIISSKDKIIPTKNQTAFWGIEPNIDSGHAPFNIYSSWNELL